MMASLNRRMGHDMRFCFRSLRRQPGFAAAATLAVGNGATTAIVSTVNAALLRPLPFPQPGDLFAVFTPVTDGRFTLDASRVWKAARPSQSCSSCPPPFWSSASRAWPFSFQPGAHPESTRRGC